MLNLHILYEHSIDLRPHGSGHIRLLRPLTHPVIEGAFKVSLGIRYEAADVLVIERVWQPGMTLHSAEQVVERARMDKACFVYTIDDNLLDLRVGGPVRLGFTPEEMMVVRYFAREADGIIVSTDQIKKRLTRFNKNIVVVPNALDERLVEGRTLKAGSSTNIERKTIGYMGTYTHDEDIMMVAQALREILRKHKYTVELQIVGGIADSALITAFDGLPLRVLDVGNNVEYPQFMRWMARNIYWDLAIAPLQDDDFTRCKSDIKFLDYSAIGVPGIYSRVAPYENTVRHLETGYLASNDTESWVEALDRMIEDDSLRLRLARKGQEYTLSTRTLQQCADQWRKAILSIAGQQDPPLEHNNA